MVKVYAYILKERRRKTRYMFELLAKHSNNQIEVIDDECFRDDGVILVWGQIYYSKILMSLASKRKVPFIQVDNGYFNAARGRRDGYLRFTKNGLVQNKILNVPHDRLNQLNLNWHSMKYNPEARAIALCVPGQNFGKYLDLDMLSWAKDVQYKLRNLTNKKIIVREKTNTPSFNDFLNTVKPYCVITHGSNVGVESIVLGYPVLCDNMCAASPVANTNIYDINNLNIPSDEERLNWAASLAYNQFSYEEFNNGVAWGTLKEIHKDILC